jgi:integrase
MLKPFTDKYLSSLKPKEKKYPVREGRGFTLQILPSGVKTFIYIYTVHGRKRYMNLGNYPHTKLAEARQAYNDAYSLVSKGIDPQVYNKSIEEAREKEEEDNSFGKFAELYLAQVQERFSLSGWFKTIQGALNNDLLPELKDKHINTIRRRDIIQILEKVGERARGQVKNVQKAASGVFDYALQREYIESNPTLNLNKAIPNLKPVQRERNLSDSEVNVVWRAIDKGVGNDETKRALKLILVTAQRPGEVSSMHSREIQVGDNKPLCLTCRMCGWWTIPKERTKNGREHMVYLTHTALKLIGNSDGYIFPSPKEDKPINRNSMSQLVSRKRVDKKTNEEQVPFYGLPRWTPHDLRRTVRTYMAKIRVPEEHAEAVLNHAKQGVVKIYNQHNYREETKAALLKWEEKLLKLVQLDKTTIHK